MRKKGDLATNQILLLLLGVIVLFILFIIYSSFGDKIIDTVRDIKIPEARLK